MSDPTDCLGNALEDRYRIKRELVEGGMATVHRGDDLKHERKVTPWLETRYQESNGAVSPHGRWAAYTSDETGSSEVYVRARPSPPRPHVVVHCLRDMVDRMEGR